MCFLLRLRGNDLLARLMPEMDAGVQAQLHPPGHTPTDQGVYSLKAKFAATCNF